MPSLKKIADLHDFVLNAADQGSLEDAQEFAHRVSLVLENGYWDITLQELPSSFWEKTLPVVIDKQLQFEKNIHSEHISLGPIEFLRENIHDEIFRISREN